MTPAITMTPAQMAEFGARCMAYGMAMSRYFGTEESMPHTTLSMHPDGLQADMLATADGDISFVIASANEKAFFIGEQSNTDDVYILRADMEDARQTITIWPTLT